MSEQPTTTYDYAGALNLALRQRAQEIKNTRYSPWRLAAYVIGALATPCVLAGATFTGYWYTSQSAWLLIGVPASLLSLPLPFLVVIWVGYAWQIERQRLIAEKEQLCGAPSLPVPPAPATAPAQPAHLQPGIVANGRVVARAPEPSAERVWLRNACLKHLRLGQKLGKWTRSELAEGDGAPMSGPEWDASSPELQHLGYLWNKPGKGGGLQPVPGKDLNEAIARLEVAL